MVAGKSGIDYITLCDAEPLETKIAGEVKGFDPNDYINRKDVRRMDRFAQLAVAAGFQAVKQADLQIDASNEDDIGVFIGSGIGGLTTLFEQSQVLLEKGPDRVSPFLAPMMIADIAAAQVSIALGVKGPNFCTTSACSSGSDAIGVAYELIKNGNTQTMIAGGTEAIINQLGITAFNALKALSTRNDAPQQASRPFGNWPPMHTHARTRFATSARPSRGLRASGLVRSRSRRLLRKPTLTTTARRSVRAARTRR